MRRNGYRNGRECWACGVKRRETNRRYRQDNKEKVREQKQLYNEANKERLLEQKRSYYQANKEKFRERNRRYHEKNREKNLAAMRKRYENLSGFEYNREQLRLRRANALARMAKREARGKELRSG